MGIFRKFPERCNKIARSVCNLHSDSRKKSNMHMHGFPYKLTFKCTCLFACLSVLFDNVLICFLLTFCRLENCLIILNKSTKQEQMETIKRDITKRLEVYLIYAYQLSVETTPWPYWPQEILHGFSAAVRPSSSGGAAWECCWHNVGTVWTVGTGSIVIHTHASDNKHENRF